VSGPKLVDDPAMADLVRGLIGSVADELAQAGVGHLAVADRRELARDLTVARLGQLAATALQRGTPPLPPEQERAVVVAVLDGLFGLGRLQRLIEDPTVENIDVNGCDEVWVTRADGSKERADPVADDDEELVAMVRAAAARFGATERRFDSGHPELDLRLPDGSRLSAVMGVAKRPAVSVRRHRLTTLGLGDLVELGSLPAAVADLLAAAVRARKNVVVGGAMNSGKTTLLRALASEVPPEERLVTIEQAYELELDADRARHPDVVALEAREANAEGSGAFPMARLVRRALRMNADRVIVGEVLGDEVLPMLNAMSQGRAGSMCTIHANSARGVFRRIAAYAVQAPERLPLEATNLLIAGAVDFVVFLEVERAWEAAGMDERSLARRPSGGRQRFVSSVLEVTGADGLQVVANEVFRPGPGRRAVAGAPLRAETLSELRAFGLDPRVGVGGGYGG
jgi:Flp pilus assembly CpaF family ATPase